ncbi:hypothetical protein PCANB_001634 [Pneumocystis canis]|nr:hypothetical protein PCK1_001645 [Pneumocystis canis]KAG5436881.1 hypothetical protein PCANB_001634 [Pneumocystis canis]
MQGVSSKKTLSSILNAKTTHIFDFLSPTTSWQLNQTLSPYFKSLPDISRFKQGKVLPEGYNYLYFARCEPEERLAKDGYDTVFSPSVNWIRRLWAKGSLEYMEKDDALSLKIGHPAVCIETVEKVDLENYKDNTIAVWTCKNIIPLDENRNAKKICLKERTCFVYQSNEKIQEEIPKKQKKTWIPDFFLSITPSQILLFRYSALTFNTHRIHYDYSYLKEEKYKNLLVQGSLSIILLLELLRKHITSDLRLKSFHYTIQRPLYVNSTYKFCGRRLKKLNNVQYNLWVESDDFLHIKGTAEMW